MEKRRIWVCIMLVGVLGVLLNGLCYAQQTIKWKGQTAYNPVPNVGPFNKEIHGTGNSPFFFAKWIERETKGRLKIDMARPGAIVPVKDMFKAVSKGALDFGGIYYGGFHTGIMPETNIEIGLPFAWERLEEAWDAYYNRGLLEEFQKIYAEHNIFFTPWFSNAHYSFGTTFDCSGIDSIKGKKIRALGIYGDFVKALGAAPVVLPGGEVYMALKLGTIDGAIFGLENVEIYKLKEVWKSFVYTPNFNTVVPSILINMDSWKKLPEDIKDLIVKYGKYILLETSLVSHAWEHYWSAKSAKEYPFKLVYWPAEDVEKARKIGFSLWDSVAKQSPRCAKLVDMVRDQMRDLGKMD